MIFLLLLQSLWAKPLDANLMYFVLIDRFANGNQRNDKETDKKDIQAFHGGDLQGVSQKIDHLQQLGADVIWLSPVFHMRTEKFEGHGAFHGYWVQDLNRIEPRFGGERAFKKLAKNLRKNNIHLVLDMVYNHVSFDSHLITKKPDWFHPARTIKDWNDPIQLEQYQVHGLPDLNQSKPQVYDYLRERSLYWHKKGDLRGFRIDAIRHMNSQFLLRMANDLHQNISPDFWLLGEDFQGNPLALAQRAKETNLDALFDFPLYYAMTNVFCDKKSPANLGVILWADRYYPTNFQQVNFLDNHDLPRIHSRCTTSHAVDEALLFMFSVRGIPMLTYGFEEQQQGPKEPENRRSMTWKKNHDAIRTIRQLRDLRAKYPVLKTGKGKTLEATDQTFIYQQTDQQHRSIVVINHSKRPIPFPTHQQPETCLSTGSGINQTTKTTVDPGQIQLCLFSNQQPVSEKPLMHEVEFIIEAPQKGQLYVVGSTVELGAWQPQKGLRLQWKNGHWEGKVTLPKNMVAAWKPVCQLGEKWLWDQGENRILWKNQKIQGKMQP